MSQNEKLPVAPVAGPPIGRVDATKLRATVCGIEYLWCGGLGSVISSRERGIRRNDVRIIGGVIFYAFTVGDGWLADVCWCPQGKIDFDWLRAFKSELFAI